ncbi:prepilin-type N-terminal cleavage/methylation domain-containing protein [Planctomycetales bacterium]|nr:prepilin-type N-terminal cleavage/methylation domain-containing protein [Planctomycetales bacterium]
MRKSAFTLIELLAVIAIIGIMTAMLLPAIQSARSAARLRMCQNKMRQLGLAIHQFENIYQVLPPSKFYYRYNEPTKSNPLTPASIGHNLIPFLLPYLEQGSAYSQYRFDVNWQNAANYAATKNRFDVLLCSELEPERFCQYSTARNTRAGDEIVEFFCSDYAACDQIDGAARRTLKGQGVDRQNWHSIFDMANINTTGRRLSSTGKSLSDTVDPSVPFKPFDSRMTTLDSILAANPISFEMITDGLSNTMMLFECTGRPFKFGRNGVPEDTEISPRTPLEGARWADVESTIAVSIAENGQLFNNCNHREIYSLHPNGANFLYGDGCVRFHSTAMSSEAFVGCFTAYGNDTAILNP